MPVVLACACAALILFLAIVQLASDSFAARAAAQPGSVPWRVSPAWALSVYRALDRAAPAPYVKETLARAALESGDPAAALRYATRLPASPERNEILARVAQRRAQPVLALEYFFAAPDIDEVQMHVDAIGARDPAAALDLERRLRDRLAALNTHPDAVAEADWRMGVIASREAERAAPAVRGAWNLRALQSYELAHSLAPFSSKYGLTAANQAYSNGDDADAGLFYRQTVEQDPGSADAVAGLGLVALRAGRRAQAENYLARARGIDARAQMVRVLERELQ